MFFVSNLQSFSQAGRRGFEPRLPLHVFNSLAVSIGPLGACYLSEMECSDSNPLIPRDFSAPNASRSRWHSIENSAHGRPVWCQVIVHISGKV
jgi:hypothetical protein